VQKLTIVNGLLYRLVDVSPVDLVVHGSADFVRTHQLFDENGRPVTSNYQGLGGDYGDRVMLGDPWVSTQLPEYTVGPQTPENAAEERDFVAGWTAAVRAKRRRANPSRAYLEGYAAGQEQVTQRGW
jgi:hypothetical protein